MESGFERIVSSMGRIVRLSHCRLIDKHNVCGFDLLSVGIRTTVHTRWRQSMGAKKYHHHTTPSISYTTTFLPSELTETFSRTIIDGMTTYPSVLSHLSMYLDHQFGNDPRVGPSSYFGNRRKRCRFGTPQKQYRDKFENIFSSLNDAVGGLFVDSNV